MEFKEEFELAKKAIREAGKLVLSSYQKELQIELKEDGSVITKADKNCENFLKRTLEEKFPNYGFIGEETTSKIKEVCWIIDPIDGTIAYSRKIPEFGIAIALKAKDEIIFSLQYVPLTSDLYHAYLGKGAYKNNAPVKVSDVKELRKCLMSFGMQNFWNEEYKENIFRMVKHRRFRVGHSSVIESCYLACGKIDILIKFDQKLWDTAPEYLLMKEAGAIITDIFGNPFKISFLENSKNSYIATNKYLSQNAKDILYIKT